MDYLILSLFIIIICIIQIISSISRSRKFEKALRRCAYHCQSHKSIIFSVIGENSITQYKGVSMLILTDSQKCSIFISPVDAKGNLAEVQNITFKSTNPDVLDVVQDLEDPKKAVVVALGPLGSAQVSVQADADLGEGIETLEGILDVEVKAGKAVALTVDAGTPEEQ